MPLFNSSSELFGTTWELGDGAKNRMKSAAVLAGSNCLVQLNCPESGWRRFGHYADWDTCRKHVEILGGDRRHLFEIIPFGKPCKPYLDVDGDIMPPGCDTLQQLVDRIQALVVLVFREDYLIDLPEEAFHWLHSPNPEKISLHLVISTHAPQLVFNSNHFTDPHGAYHLAKRIADLDPECTGQVVDLAVYTRDREMRVCGASKYGKTSVLRPLSAEELTAEPPLAPDDSLITALDPEHLRTILVVPENVPLIVRRAKRPPRICREIMEDGDAPPTSLVCGRMLELLQEHLHPTAFRERPHASEDVRAAVRFSYRNRSEACYTGVVHGPSMNLSCFLDDAGDIHAKCFSPLCAHAPPARLGRLHPEPERHLSSSVLINTPFLSPAPDDPDPHVASQDPALDAVLRSWIAGDPSIPKGPKGPKGPKTVSIRSPMGSGKTTLLDRLLLLLTKQAPPDKPPRVLVLTYRQTLAYEQVRKLASHGFVSYLDVDHDAPFHSRKRYPRVICQIESLRRVAGPSGLYGLGATFDLVVIDEIESVLRHFCSPTVGSPYSSLELVTDILHGASRVIAMDAFLGDGSFEFFNAVGISNQVVVNAHKTPPRTFEFTNHENAWRARIADDLLKGRNVVVASLSTQLIYKVRQNALDSAGIDESDILVHTSKSGDDIKKALVDVDSLWTKYRLVLYSPTISAGVDFSTYHFHTMYLYVCPLSASPLGTLQMTGRIRKLVCNTICCCAASNVRLAGKASRRAITAAESLKFLRWLDTRVQEKQLSSAIGRLRRFRLAQYPSDNSHDLDDLVCGPVMLPEESPLLLIQARERAERENASFRFIYEFRDMAVAGGHSVVILADASLTSQALVQGVEDEAAQEPVSVGDPDGLAIVIDKMLAGSRAKPPDDVDPAEHYSKLQARVYGNEASEDDKWEMYSRCYMAGWGLDRLDKPFIRVHGVRPSCPKVAQLIRVLYPPLCAEATLDTSVSGRVFALRTPLLREVIAALGFASPFDTSHRIPDLMALWEEKLKKTEYFSKYKQSSKLFGCAGKTSAWTLQTVSKALGTLFGAIGLHLNSVRTQSQDKGVKTSSYTYNIDPVKCSEMLELVRIKMRTSSVLRSATPNKQARELLLADYYPKYGHLLDLEKRTLDSFAFLEE
jgi:hypothetical protein